MSERSTAAVSSADDPNDAEGTTRDERAPGTPAAAEAGTTAAGTDTKTADDTPADTTPPDETPTDETATDEAPAEDAPKAVPAPPELHSGHKLAGRYRLEECLTKLDGFSSWRAVDEKLRRAVGIHVLPAGHDRATPVLAAARSSALLGDPRFVQVLDAIAEDELSYVVHEWLPDAVELSTLLAGGQPLEAHEAYQLVQQVSQAMTAAHREGLAHLCLSPSAVLRTSSGQYRIRGLAVQAALRGISAERPQRTDTEAVGALLYASLTARWPYEEDAYGLQGLPKGSKGSSLPAPDQVRAGVHRGLSELAMRALVNDGATPTRLEPPCTTPEELSAAVAKLPRIRPPEPAYTAPEAFRAAPYRPAHPGAPAPTVATPTLPGRTGKALKWSVSALLIAALALGSWQLADTLMNRGSQSDDNAGDQQRSSVRHPPAPAGGKPVTISAVRDFDPLGNGEETPSSVPKAYDGNAATFWNSQWYTNSRFGNLKSGIGLILDLGKARQVGGVKVTLVGDTAVAAMAAPRATTAMPGDLSGFAQFDTGKGNDLTLKPKKPVITRYVLVWLTELPMGTDGQFRGKISEISVTS
ncbi:protein kinase family protein [Streptomyces smaragdinus]|uniref:protein kinase family protein n=1 Tax=Streptomyces smaragdinus TaxID=2585196 RepID=UPI002B21F8CE|nr:protein kinase family protein [Streptomyces smaragdinus]